MNKAAQGGGISAQTKAEAEQTPQPAAPKPQPVPQQTVPQAEAPKPKPVPQAAAPKPQPVPQAEAPKPQHAPQAEAPKPQPAPQAEAPKPQPVPQPAAPKPQPAPQAEWVPPPIRQPVKAAYMKWRHWGVILSFLILVLLPLGVSAFYLWAVAKDQYSSITGFTVRQEETGGASGILGGLAQITGSSVGSDGDILYEFVLSQALIRTIEENVGIIDHYSANWGEDPVFSLEPDATIEDLESFWGRIVRVSYDQGSGLMELRVLAFDPEKAQAIATEIVQQSQLIINQLNSQAREDAMRYARLDLAEAVDRLKQAREALTAFRIRTRIVDPEADIQGRMGVLNNLQQQLAQALIDLDLLSESATPSDPRVTQAERRIAVIQERIAQERISFASDSTTPGTIGEDYPTLIAEFEGLTVDREFAEQSYRAALTALDVARAQASRQSRYLAVYIQPTLAEASEYPQRWVIFGLITLFLTLSWAIIILVYYSIRDRS